MGLSRGHILFFLNIIYNFFSKVGPPALPSIRLWGSNIEKVKINLLVINNAYIEVVLRKIWKHINIKMIKYFI